MSEPSGAIVLQISWQPPFIKDSHPGISPITFGITPGTSGPHVLVDSPPQLSIPRRVFLNISALGSFLGLLAAPPVVGLHPVGLQGLHLPSFKTEEGFPGGAVVESLPANAGDTGSSPGLGRSHMPWSNWAREPQLLSLRVWSLCPAAGGAVVVRGPRTAMKSGPHTTMKSGPRLPQLEKALARNEDPTQLKINK